MSEFPDTAAEQQLGLAVRAVGNHERKLAEYQGDVEDQEKVLATAREAVAYWEGIVVLEQGAGLAPSAE